VSKQRDRRHEVIGTSSESWERRPPARTAIEMRRGPCAICESRGDPLHVTIDDGKVVAYRVRPILSFKYDSERDGQQRSCAG